MSITDPRTQVMMVATVAEEISEAAALDTASTVMILLTAAAYVTMRYLKPGRDVDAVLGTALGSAIVAAEEFFGNDKEETLQ